MLQRGPYRVRMNEQRFREGQRVWHKSRPATFLYYAGDTAAVVHFQGRKGSTAVGRSSLSASQDDGSEQPRRQAA